MSKFEVERKAARIYMPLLPVDSDGSSVRQAMFFHVPWRPDHTKSGQSSAVGLQSATKPCSASICILDMEA
jgi:hypothetical protein